MKKSKVGGLVFVGCMMAGMGVGFAGRAIMMISDSERNQNSPENTQDHD